MTSYSKEYEELLVAVRVGIDNTRAYPLIKGGMGGYGYNDSVLDNAWNKNLLLDAKYKECQRKHGEQIEATQALYTALDEEIVEYMSIRKLAKRALRGDKYKGTREKLGIDDELKRAYDGFLDQSSKLYKHAGIDQGIMTQLANFNITVDKLQERLNGLERLGVLNSAQEAKKGEAQVARKERDDLFDEVHKWYSDFKEAARIAFKDTPEYLEIMGIGAPAEITRSKPEVPEPVETPTCPLLQKGENTQNALADQAMVVEKKEQKNS
jgi:hypothetical protein